MLLKTPKFCRTKIISFSYISAINLPRYTICFHPKLHPISKIYSIIHYIHTKLENACMDRGREHKPSLTVQRQVEYRRCDAAAAVGDGARRQTSTWRRQRIIGLTLHLDRDGKKCALHRVGGVHPGTICN